MPRRKGSFRSYKPVPGAFSPDAKGFLALLLALPHDDSNDASVAIGYFLNGDRNKGFEYLEKPFANGDDELIFAIRYPSLDPIRSDPRYADLMRRLNLPE